MRRKTFYKMVSRILAVAVAVTLCPASMPSAQRGADQKMVTKSSIGTGVTKVRPEKNGANAQTLEVGAEDGVCLIGKQAAHATEQMRLEEGTEGRRDETENGAADSFGYRKYAGESDGAVTSSGLTGQCGENVRYEIHSSTGHVVVSGSGAMTDYEHASNSPFYSHSGDIKSVEIQSGVTSVGANSFTFCYDLEQVSLPDSVTSIGDYSFLGCVSLCSLDVSEKVKNIGKHAIGFYCSSGSTGSYNKARFTLFGKPGSMAETYAKENNLTFKSEKDLTGTCGENLTWQLSRDTGVLTISGEGAMDDYIAYYAPHFPCHDRIKSIVLEEGVTEIGNGAFRGLKNVQKVTLPQSLKIISAGSFAGCEGLQEISLPMQLKHIGDGAFSGSSLKQIFIPKNVLVMGGATFSECGQLEKIEVDPENQFFVTDHGIVYDRDKTRLVIVPKKSSLSKLVIPDTVREMDKKAIDRCGALKYIIFEGGSPSGFNSESQKLDYATIFYDSSKEGWDSWDVVKTSWPDGSVFWRDTLDLKDQQSLAIQADSRQLAVGEATQLVARLDPSLALEFTWSSSDQEVAVVSNTGYVNAVGPGNTEIRAESADGQYSASISITVTGKDFSIPSHDLSALENVLDYTSSFDLTRQFPSEKLHGVYFLNKKELGFYSLVNKKYRRVLAFGDYTSALGEWISFDAFAANDKLYILGDNMCYIFDLETQSILSRFAAPGFQTSAIGADDQGRVYIARMVNDYGKYAISLMSEDGKWISDLTLGANVYAFHGFDAATGSFYMESRYEFSSWGYGRPGRGITMGKVVGNKMQYVETYTEFLESGIITRSLGCLEFVCQDSYRHHQKGAELFGGKYLVTTSNSLGRVQVFDSSSSKEDEIASVLTVERSPQIGSDSMDLASIGVRAAYNKKSNSMIIYENDNTFFEYDLSNRRKIATGKTAHDVFDLLQMGDHLIAIEKEQDSYYMEILDWGAPGQIKIQAEETTMKVGATQALAITGLDRQYELLPVWSSSDNSILTVDQSGKVAAWKEGTAMVTAKVSDAVSDSVEIRVTADNIIVPEKNVVTGTGASSNNYSDNNYSVYGKVVNSYFVENKDQSLTRVEYIPDIGVQIENYSKNYELLSDQVLEAELPKFGGFYAGKNENYLVFGQKNASESDSVEVMRIVKYSKDWQRQGQASVKGANTYIPFEAGSLRMSETDDGRLYIHTCHEMYVDSKGVHHQANMTYVLKEESMEIEQSYYDIMNIAQAGYVSHSFNQYVQTDGKYAFRVDHGDAFPTRAVTLTRCDLGGKITDVAYALPLSINTVGNNDTGVSVGGLELSEGQCLIVGNSVDQTKQATSGVRNVFLTATDKSLFKTRTVWLTDYASDSKITARTPHIVKLNEGQFLILWEEYNSATKAVSVKMVTVDGEGNLASKMVETKLRLSDCKPIMTSDGLVKWYVTENETIAFCELNPYKLEDVKGEVPISAEKDWDEFPWETPGPGGTQNPPGNIQDPGNTEKPAYLARNKTFTSGSLKYKITASALKNVPGKVSVVGLSSSGKKKSSVNVKNKVTYSGISYKVTAIGNSAFKNSAKLKKATLGTGIKSIPKNAFSGCKKLASVTAKGVSKINQGAFKNCKALKKLTLRKKITVKRGAFKGCKKAIKVTGGSRKVNKANVKKLKKSGYKKFK